MKTESSKGARGLAVASKAETCLVLRRAWQQTAASDGKVCPAGKAFWLLGDL